LFWSRSLGARNRFKLQDNEKIYDL
jgi:hypothetical protein